MISFQFGAVCLLAFVILSVVRSEPKVKLLHVLFRHGDKVPHKEYQNYPKDPHRNHSYHPIGDGGLTNDGKMREYKIGLMLRERYNQFFGPDYWPDAVYARSTDLPRTQMSLQLVLAGLYPPASKQNWNPRLAWQPVSTFSVPSDQDYLLFPDYCPRYIEEYKRFVQHDDVQKMLAQYQSLMTYLSDNTGKKIDASSGVYHLYNLLKEQLSQNLTLPKWSAKVFPNPMKKVVAIDFKLRSYTKVLRRLNGGILLRKMIDDVKDLRAGNLSPPDRKAFLFGAHELNIAALVHTLGTNDPAIPSYGSTVIMETLQDENQIFYIRVLLWTGVTERLVVQRIPGCTEICPLDEFLRLMKDVTPDDSEYYCYGSKFQNVSGKTGPSNSSGSTVVRNYWIIGLMIFALFFSRININF